MRDLIPLALFGWIPACIAMFVVLPPRRAVIAAYLAAWLFLPIAGYDLPGIPDYTKMSATTLGVLMGAAIFDHGRLFAVRLRWVDLPMVVFCISPMASSLTNGFGVYDGISACVQMVLTWGLPYFLGRVYFSELPALRELAVGIFIGGLIYVPLCLFEMRFSPQLHRLVYGAHPADFVQSVRMGGFRPTIFMQHGLMVAMWMTATAIMGVYLWGSGSVKQMFGVPMHWLVPPLIITASFCRSMGALLLMLSGIGMFVAARFLRVRIFLIFLAAIAPVYMFLRAFDLWDATTPVELISMISTERAASLQTRLNAESTLANRIMLKPVFGWGGWGGYRVVDESGQDRVATDGLWIIILGQKGVVGLAAMSMVLLLPALLLWRRYPIEFWFHPLGAPAMAMAVLLVLYMLDNLMNAMVNPIFTLAAGASTGALFWASRPQPAPRGFPMQQPPRTQPIGVPPVAVQAFKQP